MLSTQGTPGCQRGAQCKAMILEGSTAHFQGSSLFKVAFSFSRARGAAPIHCLWEWLGWRELLHLPSGAPASPTGCFYHLHNLLLECRAGAPTRRGCGCHSGLEALSTGSSFSSGDTQENYRTALFSRVLTQRGLER